MTATRTGVAGSFLLVAAFTATFEKLHPGNAGAVTFAHAAALGFVLSVALERLGARDWRISPAAAAVCGFLVAFELVWLVGFFNLDTARAVVQWQKGLAVGTLHLVFAAAAVAYVARRSPRFYRRLAAAFVLGLAANGVYAVAQLLAAHGGHNLDAAVLGPLTGRVRPINTYGVVGGVTIYRPNGLTEDPNHLGVMTAAAVLLVTPIYLRLRTRSGRLTLGALLVFFLIVELSTLSRSGLLGLAAGLVVLALPYRRRFASRAVLVPLGVAAVAIAAEAARRSEVVATVVRSRLSIHGRSEAGHFAVYHLVPAAFGSHPLLGRGLNNFAVYYEFVTGRRDFGPHSFYVAVVVETGAVGSLLFALFLLYLFVRLRALHTLGRRLAAARAPHARRVRPLAFGLTAAVVGTMAANFFYLTMQFFYFYVVVVLALAAYEVFRPSAAAVEPLERLPEALPETRRSVLAQDV